MEGTNSFEKGLHRSNSPQMQPQGSYVDALNWIRNDSGRLVNEELEEIAQTLNGNYTILGSCPIQDSFICFFRQEVNGIFYSEIGIFDNVTKQYRQVFNDSLTNPAYLLNFSGEIDSVARINSYDEIVVYFVEKDNKPRRFNITQFEKLGASKYSNALYNAADDWNLQLNFKMAYGEYSLEGGGNLPSGTYSFVYRYVTDENNKTTFSVPSRFINIPGEVNIDAATNTPIYNDETLGAIPQTNSGLSLKIKLKNIDDNYNLIEVIVISYLGLTNTLSIRSLGTYENVLDKEIIFSSDTQYIGSAISERELLESPVFINSATSIEQKDNILVLSNITSKRYDVGFQEMANNIELNWSIDKLSVDNRRNVGGVYFPSYSYSPPNTQVILTDSVTIVKVPNRFDNNLINKDRIAVFLNNEEVNFSAPFTGYSGIDFADGSCDISVFLGSTPCQYNTSSGSFSFSITSQTSNGATVAQGSGITNSLFYTVPAPTAMSADTASTTVTIQVKNGSGVIVDTVTKSITYKLSRPLSSTGTAPKLKINKISNVTPYFGLYYFEAGPPYNPSNFQPTSITLTATTTGAGTITNGIRYQWQRNGVDISGAINATYTVAASDFSSSSVYSNTYTCEATFLYSGGTSASLQTVAFPTGENAQGGTGTNLDLGNLLYQDLRFSEHNPNTVEYNYQQSNVYANPFILKGFQRGEVYSFSITPIYKDGSVGFSYHIPGKPFDNSKPNRLQEWASTDEYTSSYNSAGLTGKIKHHQMPDYDVTGYIGDAHYINVLRVTATNINFTPDQLKNIQGYIIGYQPRVDDLTRRVVDTGFVKPYVNRPNGPVWKYQGSLIDGNVEFNGSFLGAGYGWYPSLDKPYTMYYSADSMVFQASALKNDYSIQQLGLITNQIVIKDPQFGKNTSIFFTAPGTGQVDQRGTRFYRHNASFCPSSLYSPAGEYILSSFPYLLYKTATVNGYMQVNLFMELNNWINEKYNKTKIKYFSYINDIGDQNNGGDVGIVNFPSSILRTTSAYTHLETDAVYIGDVRKLMVIVGVGNNNGWNRMFYFKSIKVNRTDPATGVQIYLDSTGAGDPRFRFVRITYDNDAQYGKLENGTYTPCAVDYDDNGGLANNIVLEGDIYISKVFQQMVNNNSSYDDTDSPTSFVNHSIVGYYAESKNNYALRHQENNTPTFFPKTKSIANNNGVGGIMNGPWWLDTISYNKQYSALASTRLTFPKPLFFNDNVNYTNRSVYSKQAFESELVDQYRIFPSVNFHDIPKHRGIITDTFVFNNNFFHHTEYGLWLSYFNPNTTQATSQGQVVLGNAGVFQLPSKLVLDIKGGYMGTMDKSGTNTPFGRVFLDHKQGKIFLFAGDSPIEISDLGLFSFFREFVNITDKYCMGYDWANKRLLINNITKSKAISFYPKTQTWTSFHTFSPEAYFNTNGYSYAFGENFVRGAGMVPTFFNLDNSNGIRKGSYITYVENTAPDAFKRFDKIEINTMSGGNQGINSPGFVEPDSYVFNDKSFTHIHAWTDRQNTTELPFAYSHDYTTNFLASYETNKVPVNYYKSSFHAELPLDAVIDPYKNIFDLSNTDINADFRAHMKGKFLYTKLSYNDDKPLVLNYVKTFFKPSVA